MSNQEGTMTTAPMDLDDPTLVTDIMTITTIHELPEDESTSNHLAAFQEGEQALVSSSSTISLQAGPAASTTTTTATTMETSTGSETPLKTQRLSINVSFLSPSRPSCASGTSSMSSSPPSASFSCNSSVASSPGGAISPILNPFQWTSDLRQYIMTDIGPQPSNSQVPALRGHHHLQMVRRQRSYSKIGAVCAGGVQLSAGHGAASKSQSGSPTTTLPSPGYAFSSSGARLASQALVGSFGQGLYTRFGSMTDLCTIPQDEVLPPMDEDTFDRRRLVHDAWEQEDEDM